MRKSLCLYAALIMPLLGAFSCVAVGQDEGLPAIAREVYRPHTELPPARAPRVITERLVTEPPIVPPRVIDDTPTVAGAVVSPGAVVAPAVVAPPAGTPAVVSPTVVTPAGATAFPSVFARYTFGFYDDGNADDNWYYDYYDVPKAAVVVRPTTDALPGFRTNWTYDRREEAGLFSW
jgi:hypothetical protein